MLARDALVEVVENQRGDLALGAAQLGRALRDACDDVETERVGVAVHDGCEVYVMACVTK